MPVIRVKDNEPFEKALRRFNKTCQKEGILFEVKRKSRFEKPSERKKRKMAAARKKARKAERMLVS
ncbi:MAG: 30S ribosomal protein S21 [Gemmatimonadetes bacterium]|nr:30S ribosomal protein S21 [Gemmatimonadota bacterium]